MKKILSALLIMGLLLVLAGSAFARDVRVKGYYRSNGTYVQPHYRTSPDNSILNNYSTKGNINPYTGRKGYKDPFKLPSITGSSFGSKPFGDNAFGTGSTFGNGNSFGSNLFGD